MTSEIEQLVQGMLSPDGPTRKQAEKLFESAKAGNPGALLGGLAQPVFRRLRRSQLLTGPNPTRRRCWRRLIA